MAAADNHCMSKHKYAAHARRPTSGPVEGRMSALWVVLLVIVSVTAVVGGGKFLMRPGKEQTASEHSSPPPTPRAAPSAPVATNLPTLEINKAVMVTEDLDFGGKAPTIAEALREIERRSRPDDGVGRTFAILDAYGEPTPDGKLHLSMHVSTEKPGLGSLVFKRTGKILWESKIIPPTNANARVFSGKDLLILVDKGEGNDKLLTVDGSSSPVSVLKANVKELGVPLETVWPDGMEREVTFIYSACGCPVRVMTRREGHRTVRVKELPVIFPDDPAAVQVITTLMGWK